MFSLQFIYRSSVPTLSVPTNIILTKSFSEKLFGADDPVGKVLEVRDKSYTIVGVVTDVPGYASFHFDVLMNEDLAAAAKIGYPGENHIMYNAFLMLAPKIDPKEVNNRISGMIGHWKAFKDLTLSIQPLSKVYFNGLPNDKLEHASVSLIYLLSSIALVIFFMTIFNYTNLAVSSGYERFNEIGIKKTTGARRKDIFWQVLTESLLVSLLSMFIAVLLSFGIAPLFSEILGKKFEFDMLVSQPLVLISGILLFFATGILSGVYPALSFSNVSPLQMITPQKVFKRKHQRGFVIAIQFMVATILIISILFIQKQIEFVKYSDLGFDKEMMVKLDLRGDASQKWQVLKNELLGEPGIVSVSAGSPMQTNGSASGYFDINNEKKRIQLHYVAGDEDFVKTFGLKIIKGRNLRNSDSKVCLINEHLYNSLGWHDIARKKIFGDKVVGVVKDFHYENLYTEIGNLEIEPVGDYVNILNIKIKGDIATELAYIKKAYKDIEPEVPFSFRFYDDWIQSMYQKEEKLADAVGFFAVLAIIISCLGLIGLVEHTIHKKVKEIGIRKINGAKISEILTMLNKNFIKWVIIAFVIATPVAYYAMNKWLENFAYKTTLNWWIFALAGLLALGIALLTVSWQSWRAATRNPVEALRYE